MTKVPVFENKKELLGKKFIDGYVMYLSENDYEFIIHTLRCNRKSCIREYNHLCLFFLFLRSPDCLVSTGSDRDLCKLILEKECELTLTEDDYIVPISFKDSEKSFKSISRTKEYKLFKKLLENGMLS